MAWHRSVSSVRSLPSHFLFHENFRNSPEEDYLDFRHEQSPRPWNYINRCALRLRAHIRVVRAGPVAKKNSFACPTAHDDAPTLVAHCNSSTLLPDHVAV